MENSKENLLESADLKLLLNSIKDNINLNKSGIYGFYLCNECIYIGQAHNLFYRLCDHLQKIATAKNLKDYPTNKKYKYMLKYFNNISWKIIEITHNLDEREDYWITYYNPIFNIINPDGEYEFAGTDKDIDNFILGLITMDELKKYKHLKNKCTKTKNIILNEKWLNKKLYRIDIRNLLYELGIYEHDKLLTWSKLKNKLAITGKYNINEFKDGRLRCTIITLKKID